MRPLEYESVLTDLRFCRDAVLAVPEQEFPGKSSEEILVYKNGLIDELTLDVSFKLLTKLEADIRTDFIESVRNEWIDPLSLSYRHLATQYSGSRRRAEPVHVGLIPILRTAEQQFRGRGDSFCEECAEILERMKFRNWYAHGRFLRRKPAHPLPVRVVELGRDVASKVILRTH